MSEHLYERLRDYVGQVGLSDQIGEGNVLIDRKTLAAIADALDAACKHVKALLPYADMTEEPERTVLDAEQWLRDMEPFVSSPWYEKAKEAVK